jgi:hypothetical protein
VSRTIILGQFTLHIVLFLVAALLALRRGRDGWAGVWLAAASIKPQMLVFVVPWLLVWALGQRRHWRLLKGLLAGGGALALAALALFPRWPISFVEDVLRYSKVAGGRNPLVGLVGFLWPGGPEGVLSALRYGLAGLLLLAMLMAWRRGSRQCFRANEVRTYVGRGWRGSGECFVLATYWTIVVSLLVPFQTGTTSQVMLLVPLLAWLRGALERWRRWKVLAGAGGLLAALWLLFLVTFQSTATRAKGEKPVMFLVLPLLSLAVLVGIEIHRSHSPSPSLHGGEELP